MKVSYTLIALTLLTGCSSLKPAQQVNSAVPQPKLAQTAAVDKTTTDKPKASEQKTPSTTTDSKSTKSANVSSASELEMPINLEQFSPSKVLKVGSQGDEVLALEKRLAEFHYDVGVVDSFYDQQTRQGVLAFQKYNQLERTGTYTLETQKALYVATPPQGLYPELGLPRVEVDITRQVLLFFDEQGLNRVIAVSTGSNRNYCEISKKSGKQVCGVAKTPRGTFSVQWRIPGWRKSDLGKLYNPLYFNGGFAIHGSPSVPYYNASHGCIRISIATSLWFYDAVKNDTPVIVFGG